MSQPLATLTVAPLEDESSGSDVQLQRRNRRVHLAPELLRSRKLAAGDWVLLRAAQEGAKAAEQDVTPGWVVAQLWPRVSLEEDTVALTPSQISNLGASEASLYKFPAGASKGVLKAVTVKAVSEGNNGGEGTGEKRELEWKRAAVKEALTALKYVGKGTTISIGDSGLRFVVSSFEVSTKVAPRAVGGPDAIAGDLESLSIADMPEVYEVEWRSKIIIEGEDSTRGSDDKGKSSGISTSQSSSALPSYINIFSPSESSSSSYNLLGGLDAQIKQVKALLDLPLKSPELFARFGLTPPRGLLLHGPPGTGKTALARAIASSTPGCSCIVVNGPELSSAFHGETEERIRGVFDEARRRSPCIIVFDEIDALCPRRDGGEGGEVERRVVAMLLTLMDGMGGSATTDERVIVIAATNRPNSIDPALRRPGRFDREIEIGIPDAQGRRHILEVMLAKMPHSLTEAEIEAIANRTHGYVGADLGSLVRESASTAIQRWADNPAGAPEPLLTNDDVLTTLPTIRPSAMREVFLETPSVRWTDIGGQDDVKQKLKECVEWPLTHGDTFSRLGVEAPRGVLLYGPPGCSKTLTAKALATESGINFIAVKGPELLNKYVGESERAVREVFRKARAASPSIVFFDEIDALGADRDGGETHGGVLTSLLNEMDGIEQLSGVTVVAATNRPDVLDPALTRPGRLDRILYVGAPDLATRRDIFRIRFAAMAVDPNVDIDELARITEGCSGAEVASICQDAALATMNEDLTAPFVKNEHLLNSARTVRRRITPQMLQFFEEWRDQSGIRSA